MTRTLLFLACAAVLSFATWGCDDSGGGGGNGAQSGPTTGQADKLRIAVIPKGMSHVFWLTLRAGAEDAGRELGAEILWQGPLREDENRRQIGIVEEFVTQGVSGIALAPVDRAMLVPPVDSAKEKNIPVVIYDSSLEAEVGKDFVSFVATDNKKGGYLGGKELARLLGGKGKVVMLRYAVGSASTEQREDGFMQAMKENPGIEVISENQYAGATSASAQAKAMNMGDVLRRADGIFAVNESSTQGMLQALEAHGLLGKAKFVGFDTSKLLVEAMEQDKIQALVSQDPRNMGYTAVKTLVDHIRGKKVPTYIDTGVHLVTKQNLSSPEIQKLMGSQLK